MFLSTSGLNQSYILKGIVNATVKRTLKAEELDEVDQFDNLYAQVQKKLENKALELDADGVIDIRFVPQIVRVSVGPNICYYTDTELLLAFLKRTSIIANSNTLL